MSSEHRAGQLAALAQLDQLALPAAARTAITGYERIMALPFPQPPLPGADRRAIAALADELARDGMTGKSPAIPSLPLDVSAVTAARQAEQESLDRAGLHRELRAAAAAVLVTVFSGDTGQQAIHAVQGRHAKVMDDLCEHARQVPEGTDDRAALEHGGPIRVHYLAARDLAVTAAQLREAVQQIEDRPPAAVDDSLELCLMFEQTGGLYQTWMAPAGISSHGPIGTLEFYLSAGREPDYTWWAPTAAELAARAGQLRQQMHADRVAGQDVPPRLRSAAVF